MKDIGSFIELEFDTKKEYYTNGIRLNTARAGIWHAIRCYGVSKVWMPVYQCDSVVSFLKAKGIEILPYYIDEHFKPLIEVNGHDSAIVLVNYYGIFNREHFEIEKYNNVIIDNAQGFFLEPISNCLNVYSCRKFFGVPDGCYVIGPDAKRFSDYQKDYSSDTASFLLMRHEYGCSGKAYENRKDNEKRINESDCMLMSDLTRILLCSQNYDKNKKTRRENFIIAKKYFDQINQLSIEDNGCSPMVYPLLVDVDIIEDLHSNSIFQGHWWEYLVDITNPNSFENRLSRFIIPITIDQRYGEEEIKYQYEIIMSAIDKRKKQ